MKKLTKDQEETIENQRLGFIEQNEKSHLFDISKIRRQATETRELIDKLTSNNTQIKNLTKHQFTLDIKRLKLFLDENADAVEVKKNEETEPNGYFEYSIGVNDNKKVHVIYKFSRQDFEDWNQAQDIDGIKHEVFKMYEIEIWSHQYDSEYKQTFEDMFKDDDVVDMFERAVLDYIVYGSKKNTK